MKVLITGSESFVGKELINQLKKENITIVGFDAIDAKHDDYEFHKADIRDPNLSDIIPDDVDTLIHLAALSRDPDCRGKPYECFDINVMGTLNLMNACTVKKIKQFIFASSEWVYDKFSEGESKDESAFIDISNHQSEYALSKLVTESNLRQKYEQGFSDVTILRFGIIYGPRKNNWAAVESIFSTIKNNSEVTVGSLNNARRFIHISDIANGIKQSLNLPGFNILNLTGNKLITLKELIDTSQIVLDKSVTVIEKNPSEINVRNPSNENAKRVLSWTPLIDLKHGLETLIPYV